MPHTNTAAALGTAPVPQTTALLYKMLCIAVGLVKFKLGGQGLLEHI